MSMAQAVIAHTLSSVLNYLDISPFRSLNFWHLIQAVCLQMIHAWRYKQNYAFNVFLLLTTHKPKCRLPSFASAFMFLQNTETVNKNELSATVIIAFLLWYKYGSIGILWNLMKEYMNHNIKETKWISSS